MWQGCVAASLEESFRRFISLCERRDVRFTLNGLPVKRSIPRFRCLRLLQSDGAEWAHLGVYKFERGLLLVRIGGLPMFVERTDYKRTLVLELQGASGERLTANRDSLRYPHSTHLRDLITQMAVDRRSALKREEPVYTRFAGPKLHRPEEPKDDAKLPADNLVVERRDRRPIDRAGRGRRHRRRAQGRIEARRASWGTSSSSRTACDGECRASSTPRT